MTGLPVSVQFRSRGALLLCGDADRVRTALPLIPSGIKTLAVVDGGLPGINDTPSLQVVSGAVVQVRGHLGRFRASVAGPDGVLDLGALSANQDGLFDLVADLYDHPLIDLEVAPLGYVRTRGRSEGQEERFARLSRMVGTVNKPRYFSFDDALCAHDRQGVPGCRRCLESCPAGAIGSAGDGIRIDPYLCRGCGSCTLVCPTGAVRYARPGPAITLRDIAQALASAEPETAPVLVIHAGEDAGTDLPPDVRSLRVPAIGSIGPELWLSALALGASRVVILCTGLLPPTTHRILETQVGLIRNLLGAIGQAPERVRLVRDAQSVDWGGLPNSWPAMASGLLEKQVTKRVRLMAALEHLTRYSKPVESQVSLPAGAPFGSLAFQESRCTLCMSCTRLCPTAALRAAEGALVFKEADCVQCGLCVHGCPEKAVDLIPGFDVQAAALEKVRMLKPASEPFHCVQCGTPFASRSLVEGSMAHVQQHPMFQGEGRRLLEMCMECRQRITLESGTAPRPNSGLPL